MEYLEYAAADIHAAYVDRGSDDSVTYPDYVQEAAREAEAALTRLLEAEARWAAECDEAEAELAQDISLLP